MSPRRRGAWTQILAVGCRLPCRPFRWGPCPCNGGDDITPSHAALREFDPAEVRSGVNPGPHRLGSYVSFYRVRTCSCPSGYLQARAFSFRFRSEFAVQDEVRATSLVASNGRTAPRSSCAAGRRLQAMTAQSPPPEPRQATSWVIIAGLILIMLLASLSAMIPNLSVMALSE